MTIKIRHILAGATAVLLLAGLGMLRILTRQVERSVVCTGMDIHLGDSLNFVSKEDIKSFIDKEYGCWLGQKLDSMDLPRIEDILESEGMIHEGEAWLTGDGILHIYATQRAPVLCFRNAGNSFYVDSEGYIFPLHENFSTDVPAVEGRVPVRLDKGFRGFATEDEERAWIQGVLDMYAYVQNSRTWKGSVTGMVVEPNGDLSVRLWDYKERFVLGGTDRIAEKFALIEKYIQRIRPTEQGQKYRRVTVKYKGQIICRTTDT